MKNRSELESIEQELQTLPTGTLRKQGHRYIHANKGSRKALTKDKAMIKSLARRKILELRKKQLQQTGASPTTFQALIALLPELYQGLPISYFYHPTVEKFQIENVTDTNFRKDELSYQTNGGISMRSKSEILIGNSLEERHIPYGYERKTRIDTPLFLPDFTIIKPFTGETVIWEHFGALQQEGYEQRMNQKMLTYYKQGLVPFENLIYTFEFDISYPKRIQAIIENLLY